MDSTISYKDAGLSNQLSSQLENWQKSRDNQELTMRNCYADEMRIPRDDDTKGTGQARTKKTKGVFVGVTRNKIRAAKAKLCDSLFGTGKMPFDVEPNKEELEKYATCVEKIVTEQLLLGNYIHQLRGGVHRLCTYGTAHAFGPFVRQEEKTSQSIDMSQGFSRIVENKISFDLPYFEFVNPLDVYPDPNCANIQKGQGVYWVTMESPVVVKSWSKDESYKNIDDALKVLDDNIDGHGSDQAQQLRGNNNFWREKGRIKVARYFGIIKESALGDDNKLLSMMTGGMENEVTEAQEVTDEDVECLIVIAGGVVVRKDRSEYKKRPVYPCVYEAVPDEQWGVGIAENNMAHQALTNAAFRLFNESKGMSLLGTKAVDRSCFLPTEDFKKYPGKVYQFKPNLSADEKKAAIIDFVDTDISSGWRELIDMSQQFSDDDTGITKYTQGDDASHLNKTATGISMIMGASALPLKDVLSNIDAMWIEPMIEALIDWNLRFLEPETVQKMLGDECAEDWKAVKEYGKASFMSWRATGASTFMQKEVLANKLQGFIGLASQPMFANLVDWKEMLSQSWDVLQMGLKDPFVKDDKPQIPPEIQQQAEQAMQHIEEQDAKIKELEEQLKEAKEKADIDAYNAETNRMKVLQDANAIDPQQLAMMAAQLVMQSLQNPIHEDEQEPMPQQFEQEPMPEQIEMMPEQMGQHQMPDGSMMQDDEMMGGGDMMPEDMMGDLINPSDDEIQGY